MRDTPVPSVTTLIYHLQHTCCRKEPLRLLNLRVQHAVLVNKALTVFPNLVRLQIGETVEWSREQTSSHWKPHLINLPLVRELLLRQDVRNVDDVDGCLRSALWEKDLTLDVRTRLGYSFRESA